MQKTLSSQFQPYLKLSLIQIPHTFIKPCYGIRLITIIQSLINEYNLNKKQPYTQGLKFSWQCGWGFKFSVISHCAIRWVVPNILPLDKTMSGKSWEHNPGVRTVKVRSIQKRVAAITKLVPEYMLLMLTSPNKNVLSKVNYTRLS